MTNPTPEMTPALTDGPRHHTLSRLRATALATLVGIALIPASADAVTGTVVTRDGKSDVRSLNTKGLTANQRNSIGLSRIEIRPTSNKIRYMFRLRNMITNTDWDQMVFVVLEPPPGTNATWTSNVGATTKGDSYAYYATDDTYDNLENCAPNVRLHRAQRQRIIDVPLRRTPSGPAAISARSLTGYFETDAPPWSSDRVSIGDPVTLRD